MKLNAMQAVYALSKVAAAAIEKQAEDSGRPPQVVLREACRRAFGREPIIQ